MGQATILNPGVAPLELNLATPGGGGQAPRVDAPVSGRLRRTRTAARLRPSATAGRSRLPRVRAPEGQDRLHALRLDDPSSRGELARYGSGMCAACAMAAMAGATGARSWLQARHDTWLTPRRM